MLTGREVVANHVPGIHSGEHGTLLAKLDSAAEASGLSPQELREMAPGVEVAHVGVLAKVRGVRSVLAIVPHVSGGHLDGTISALLLGVVRRTPHGEVLAVAKAVDTPVETC